MTFGSKSTVWMVASMMSLSSLSSTTTCLASPAIVLTSAADILALEEEQHQRQSSSWQSSPDEDEEDTAAYYASLSVKQVAFMVRPPIIIEDMALALRWTAECNRQLQQQVNTGMSSSSSSKIHLLVDDNKTPLKHHHQPVTAARDRLAKLRGGESSSSSSFPSGVAALVAPESFAQYDDNLTVFHAKHPRRALSPSSTAPFMVEQQQPRGAARWGPEITQYLDYLLTVLGLQEDNERNDASLVLTLAMIYLDRACSVETPRSNGATKCPFCTPRTLHRLVLSAILLAIRAMHGNERYRQALEVLSSQDEEHEDEGNLEMIPLGQMRHMVDWMREALGDLSLFVMPDQMQDWCETWETLFPTSTTTTSTTSATSSDHQATTSYEATIAC